ncbi:MAG: phosphoribosylanthranilate isomerase [Ignavibacteriae bacterium]|nr:MAG: phosphoribosylanthranilate isomerase [Ignavibacteriota bacterium]
MEHQRTLVKICCMGSIEDAQLAIRLGAAAIGLVSEMPSGPGVIPEDLIRDIAQSVPDGIETFLLTCRQDPAAVILQQRKCGVTTIQLVDAFPLQGYSVLRQSLPGIRLVQVIHVTGESSIQDAAAVAPLVDALLLDSGKPSLAVKELGGTGRTHDWTISRRIRDRVHIPVYLAGGLTPENVQNAIEQVHPYAVDVCSGVRTGGRLDPHKLESFFSHIT